MADNDEYEDEYQFSDLDSAEPSPVDEGDAYNNRIESDTSSASASNVRRNALIVVVLVVLAMLAYKYLAPLFSTSDKEQVKATQVQQPAEPSAAPPRSTSVQPIPAQPSPVSQPSAEAEQKLSALEVSQQSLRQDMSTVNNQVNGIRSNVSEMASDMAKLRELVTSLSEKIDQQSTTIAQLKAKRTAKPTRKVVRRVSKPALKYYVQALIPGRAWLIASNGTTLTVREGSVIPGLGTVKLIDPHQGRVITSSGQIIRFSQNDS